MLRLAHGARPGVRARSARARLATRLQDESGVALLLALLVMFALAIGLSSQIELGSSAQRDAGRGNAAEDAFSLAEGAVNTGSAALAAAPNPAGWTPPATTQAGAVDASFATGKVRWWAACTSGSAQNCGEWTISAYSTVTNPTGPSAAPLHRTVSIRESVSSQAPGTAYAGLYSGGALTQTGNGGLVDEPIYVLGNLRLNGGTGMSAAAFSLNVGGNLELPGGGWIGSPTTTLTAPLTATTTPVPAASTATFPSSGVVKIDDEFVSYGATTSTTFGKSSSPVTRGYARTTASAHATGATVDGRLDHVNVVGTCAGGTCDPSNNIYAKSYGTTLDPISVTQSNTMISSWYLNAAPGPAAPCTPAYSTGTLPVFDNTTGSPAALRLDHASLGAYDLTGATYDCKYVLGGTTYGEIAYNSSTHVLTVLGTIFFDRDITFSQDAIYSASSSPGATIWTSGSVAINGNLCAAGTYSSCSFTTWDPLSNQLAIIASKPPAGATYTTNNDFTVKGDVQGIFYTDGNYNSVGGAITQGAIVAPTTGASITMNGGPGLPSPGFSTLPNGVPNATRTVLYEEGSFVG
jgi:hypothetical protein